VAKAASGAVPTEPLPGKVVASSVRAKRNSAYILPKFANVKVRPMLGTKEARPRRESAFSTIKEEFDGSGMTRGGTWMSDMPGEEEGSEEEEDGEMSAWLGGQDLEALHQPLVDLETLILMTNQLSVAYKALQGEGGATLGSRFREQWGERSMRLKALVAELP